MGFLNQEYWIGLPFCSPGYFPGIGLTSPELASGFFTTESPGKPLCSVARLHQTLCNPTNCSTPAFPVLHYLLEFAQTHVHWVSDAIQPSHSPLSLLLFLLILPSIRVFSNESALHISGQSIGASASVSVLPVNIQGWFPLGLTGLSSYRNIQSLHTPSQNYLVSVIQYRPVILGADSAPNNKLYSVVPKVCSEFSGGWYHWVSLAILCNSIPLQKIASLGFSKEMRIFAQKVILYHLFKNLINSSDSLTKWDFWVHHWTNNRSNYLFLLLALVTSSFLQKLKEYIKLHTALEF